MPIKQCWHLANRAVCQFAGSLGSVTMNLSRGIEPWDSKSSCHLSYSIWDLGVKVDRVWRWFPCGSVWNAFPMASSWQPPTWALKLLHKVRSPVFLHMKLYRNVPIFMWSFTEVFLQDAYISVCKTTMSLCFPTFSNTWFWKAIVYSKLKGFFIFSLDV